MEITLVVNINSLGKKKEIGHSSTMNAGVSLQDTMAKLTTDMSWLAEQASKNAATLSKQSLNPNVCLTQDKHGEL